MSKRKKNQSKNYWWYKYRKWILLINVVLGFIVYSNTFQSSFHFDDIFYITGNDIVKDLPGLFKLKYWGDLFYRPIPTLTFAINYAVHGIDLPGYHLVNIIIHIITSIFVFLLSRDLLKLTKYNSGADSQIPYLPLLISLLFLVHPVQTSSVNYIVQRMTLMSAMFYILGVWIYIKARQLHISGHFNKSLSLYLFTVFIFYLALYSKQNAASLPFMLFIVELLFIRNVEGKPAKLYLIILGSILFLGSSLLILSDYLPKEYEEYSREIYLASQFEVILRYWRLLIFPYPLNFDPYVEVADSIWSIKYLGLGIVHIAIISFAIWFAKRNKLVSFGIFWFYIALSVESSIIPIRDLMYEHRMYLPSFGFILAFGFLTYEFIRKKYNESLGITAFAILILVFSVWSFQRNKVWESELSLWSDVIEKKPSKARAHKYLGVEYLKLGQLQKSLTHLNIAIKKQPNKEWEPYINRAALYKLQKKYALAIDDISKCIEMDPEVARFYKFRAEMLLAMNKIEDVYEDINQAIELDKRDSQAYLIRADYYLNQKQFKAAIEDLNVSLKSDADNIQAHFKRAQAFFYDENYLAALRDLDYILNLKNNLYDVYSLKGDVNFSLGNYEASVNDFANSVRLNPKYGDGFYRLGLSYYNLKDYQNAVENIKKANNLGTRIDGQIYNNAIKNAIEQ